MAQAIGVVLAVLVGIPIWLMTLLLLKDNPFGKAGIVELLIVFCPIFGLVWPSCKRLLAAGQIPAAAWVLAFGPLLSALNFGLVLVVGGMGNTGNVGNEKWILITGIVCSVLWLAPLALFSMADRKRQSRGNRNLSNDA